MDNKMDEDDEELDLRVGDEVYWTDPDEGTCSGYGKIVKINGEVFTLRMNSGGETEAFRHELS